MDRLMPINTLKIALSLSIIGFTVFAEPIQLRCHMDSCSWANIQKKYQLDNSNDGAVLYEVSYISGNSSHEDEPSYPDTYSPNLPIEWKKTLSKVMIYCSPIKPAVFDSKSIIETFEFPIWFGYEISAINFYIYTCHERIFAGNNEIFNDLGYNKIQRNQFNSVDDLLQE
jgi:hypothetical protein